MARRLWHSGRMTAHDLTFNGAALTALPTGALHWAAERLLVVSDLHFGKATRLARRGGSLLPPYETRATLQRLDGDLERSGARRVICLGDSFDDLAAGGELAETDRLWLTRMMAGRDWVWIEGNHDPGPGTLGGSHLAQLGIGPLTFRHIAAADARGEVSGHYHPKARLAGTNAPCFLLSDPARLILPAYGTFTGGLSCAAPELAALMAPGALALLTGATVRAMPFAAAAASSPRSSSFSR